MHLYLIHTLSYQAQLFEKQRRFAEAQHIKIEAEKLARESITNLFCS